MESRHPGDKIQIDIRYVPVEYIHLPGYGYWYYQITGTDEYNRKVFASEKEAHAAGIQKVKEGYEGYSVDAYDIQGDLSVLLKELK